MRPHQMPGPPPTREAPSPGAISGDLAGPFEMTLPAALDAPAAARVAVGAWMAGHVSETMRADAQLLVVELVANSVRHADAPADAVVSVRAQVARRRPAPGGGGSRQRADRSRDGRRILQHGGGFGLNLVETPVQALGRQPRRGTRVWAEIACRNERERPL